jgi:hypothetical protein
VLSPGYDDDVNFVQIISGNSCMAIRSILKSLAVEKKDDFININLMVRKLNSFRDPPLHLMQKYFLSTTCVEKARHKGGQGAKGLPRE